VRRTGDLFDDKRMPPVKGAPKHRPAKCLEYQEYEVNDCQPEAGSIDLVSGM